MRIDTILFDWGGTLARVDGEAEALRRGAARMLELLVGESNSEQVERMAAAAIAAEHRAARHPEYVEVNLRELIRESVSELGVLVDDARLDSALDVLGQHWIGVALTVMPGVEDALRWLRDRGLRIGLASNCFMPTKYCMEELRHQKIADLLDSATFSSGVGYRKPSPRFYEAAARNAIADGAGLDYSNILFVGDSPAYDVIGPAGMGMKTALVTSTTVQWSADDYQRAKPDCRVSCVSELPGVLADFGIS